MLGYRKNRWKKRPASCEESNWSECWYPITPIKDFLNYPLRLPWTFWAEEIRTGIWNALFYVSVNDFLLSMYELYFLTSWKYIPFHNNSCSIQEKKWINGLKRTKLWWCSIKWWNVKHHFIKELITIFSGSYFGLFFYGNVPFWCIHTECFIAYVDCT